MRGSRLFSPLIDLRTALCLLSLSLSSLLSLSILLSLSFVLSLFEALSYSLSLSISLSLSLSLSKQKAREFLSRFLCR